MLSGNYGQRIQPFYFGWLHAQWHIAQFRSSAHTLSLEDLRTSQQSSALTVGPSGHAQPCECQACSWPDVLPSNLDTALSLAWLIYSSHWCDEAGAQLLWPMIWWIYGWSMSSFSLRSLILSFFLFAPSGTPQYIYYTYTHCLSWNCG